MLLIFAQESPEETRQAFRTLFDESKPHAKRINEAKAQFDAMMQKRNVAHDAEAHSYIGIRFLSLLLGFRFPNEGNAIKPSQLKVFFSSFD